MVGRRNENLNQRDDYQPKLRQVDGLTIYFKSKQTIYLTDGKVAIVFERWFEGNDFYKENWKPLVETLSRRKSIGSVYKAWEIATRYGVQAHQTFHFPDIEPDTQTIKEREQ